MTNNIKNIPISNEFAALRDAIYMGYTRGRQKAIEKAFKNLDKSMAKPVKLSWWRTYLRDIRIVFNNES